jgi:hypothetical protein
MDNFEKLFSGGNLRTIGNSYHQLLRYLDKHETQILDLSKAVINKEIQWQLALLLSRIKMNKDEFNYAWKTLMSWAKDKSNSKIVRVNSMQALFELNKQSKNSARDFQQLINELQKEDIPSINARIKKFKKVDR